MIKEIIHVESFARYEIFIGFGVAMAGLTLIKLIGLVDFSSDWLWFLAGMGLAVEGTISMVKQRRFDKKFKIVNKEEYEKLIENKI